MPGRRRAVSGAVLVVAVLAGAVILWRRGSGGEEQAIRARLDGLSREVNASTSDGLGTAARAAAIGSFFTDDVVVDLGQGTPPITGRETLIGMAARLQPRTAAFRLELADIGIRMLPGATAADVTLTASFIRRSVTTGEESIDAREFSLALAKAGGAWRIARITAVSPLVK